jgi:hypothetical protein
MPLLLGYAVLRASHMNLSNLKPIFKSGRSSVGIWGCISLNFKGPLVIIPRGQIISQHRYLNEVKIPYSIPFFKTVYETEERAY